MNYRAKYDGNDAVYAIYRIFKMINDKMDNKMRSNLRERSAYELLQKMWI